MRLLSLIAFIVSFFILQSNAQVAFDITRVTADTGTEVDIEFRVTNFTNLIGFTIPMKWDNSVIRLKAVKSVANIPGLTASQDNFGIAAGIASGSMIANWDSPGFTPRSLPAGGLLFTLTFDVIGSPGTNTDIEVFDDINNNPGFINDDLNDIGFTQMKGRVTVSGMASGLVLTAGNESGTTGSLVCVKIRADGFNNVGGFQFAIRWTQGFMNLETINSQLPNFGPGDFSINNSTGIALIQYTSQGAVNLPTGSDLMELCFRVVATTGSSPVTITGIPEDFFDILFSTPAGQNIPFTTVAGSVTVGGGGGNECVPDGFTFLFDPITVTPGQTFCYPVKAVNFTEIASIQYCIQWDPAVLRFVEVSEFFLPGLGSANFNLISDGVLASVWALTTDPITMPAFSPLYSICFEVIATGNANLALQVVPCLEGGVQIEYDNGTLETDPTICAGTISVSNTVPISITLDQIVSVACPGQMNGGIAIDVTGGTEPFTFRWERAGTMGAVGTSRNLTGVGPGQYSVTVTDAQNNTATAGPFTIGTQFSINVTETIMTPLCTDDDNGSITLNISGNTGTISNIQWNPGPSGPNVTSITNIGAGTYNLRISYGQGCAFERNITVANGQSPIVNANVSNMNGNINLTVTGGASPYEYLWSDNNMDQNRTNLPSGTYSVTVTDANGCETTAGPFTIVRDNMGGSVTLTGSDYNGFGVSCNGICDGTINTASTFGMAPYTFRWSDGSTSGNRTGLCSGTYTVTVTDAANATMTASITLTTPMRIRIDLVDFTQSTMDNGSASVAATGGVAPYNFLWNDDAMTSNPQIVNQPATTRIVSVTDQNGCTATRSVNFATPVSEDCFDHRKVITPNGDGLNDELIITCLDGTTNQLDIFDRYGKLVFSARNYRNDWMGTHADGSSLPDGAYFFVLRIADAVSGIDQIVKNSFNLIRDAR